MRTIGIDLAVTAPHKAVVMAPDGQFLTPVFSLQTRWDELEQLVKRARAGVEPDHPVRAVLEPTGMAWLPVVIALERLAVTPYMVNGQKVHDLRRYYKRHSSSDRISARVLARMAVVDPESLYPLAIPSAQRLACQRGCKELDRLQTLIAASQNRLRDTDRFAWPGLEELFKDSFSPAARFFRQQWYNPAKVVRAGADPVRRSLAAVVSSDPQLDWGAALLGLAEAVLKLYGPTALDYGLLQQEVCREQRRLQALEAEAKTLWRETIRPLYRQLQPGRHLESLYGVGEQSAAVYASFIGPVERFPDNRHFRGWHGLVPDSRQSGEAESKGLHVSQAGPDLVKKFGYLDADVARRYDPQIAAVYYDQMVYKGKHHNQAVCACATHLLDRIQVVCREDRPYQLRGLDGQPITPEQARALIAERYTVPEEVRRRNNRRARRQRAEQRAERQQQKGSRSRKVRGEPSLPHA